MTGALSSRPHEIPSICTIVVIEVVVVVVFEVVLVVVLEVVLSRPGVCVCACVRVCVCACVRVCARLPGVEAGGDSGVRSISSPLLSSMIGCKPSCGEGCGVVEILELKIEIGDAMLPLACAAGT